MKIKNQGFSMTSISFARNHSLAHSTHSSTPVMPKASFCSKLTAVAFMVLLAFRGGATESLSDNTTTVLSNNNTSLSNLTDHEIQTTGVSNNGVLGIAQAIWDSIFSSGIFVKSGTVEDMEKFIDGDFEDGDVLKVDHASDEQLNKILDQIAQKKGPADWYERGKEYHDGAVGSKDIKNALKWYQKAAEGKNADAMTMLGVLYYGGKEVEKDEIRARGYIEEAAILGNANAQYQLGGFYYEGSCGYKKDLDKAIENFKKAAAQNHEMAQNALGEAYRMKENLNEAAHWYFKAAEQGNANAQYQIGDFCVHGWGGLEKNYPNAKIWLEKAAKQEHPLAQATLALLHEVVGADQNIPEAMHWHEKAANNGIYHSFFRLAVIYDQKYMDELDKPDYNSAVIKECLNKSIEFAEKAKPHLPDAKPFLEMMIRIKNKAIELGIIK